MSTDPYASPSASATDAYALNASGEVSQAVVQQLLGTKPWVRFMSVITFIGAGLMGLAAVGIAIASSVGSAAGGTTKTLLSGPVGLGIAALYLVFGCVYIIPGIKLWKYASSIASLVATGRDEDLVAALNHQRSFWKFIALLFMILIALYFVVILIASAGAFSRH